MTIKTVIRSAPRSTVAADAKVTVLGARMKSAMDLKVISSELATRKQELMAEMAEGMASVQ